METPGARIKRHVARAVDIAGGLNALGRLLGINASSVLAWTRGEAMPGLDKVAILAVVLQEDRERLRACLVDALEERAQNRRVLARPTTGTPPTALRVVPSPKRAKAGKSPRTSSGRRRGKAMLGALAVACMGWLGHPPPVVEARPITSAAWASDTGYSVHMRRRWQPAA